MTANGSRASTGQATGCASIVMNMFSEGAERNKALGIWGGISAAGATVGVLAGGLLTRYAGRPYIFYLNVPIGAAALMLARRVVPESRLASARRRYDPLGAITVTGALVILVYAISQAPTVGWTTTRTIVLLAVSGTSLAASRGAGQIAFPARRLLSGHLNVPLWTCAG